MIELSVGESEEAAGADRAVAVPGGLQAVRKKAVRILKVLPKDISTIDISEADKTCSCCGAAMTCIGVDSSEHPLLTPDEFTASNITHIG